MERNGAAPDIGPENRVRHQNHVHRPPRAALIAYGSETGNAQDVAEEIGRVTERLRFDTAVRSLDSVQVKDLVKPTIVILAISTTGQGEIPQNARAFWRALLSSALRPGNLRKVFFTSFGLGDSSYAQYNVAHRMLHGRLQQLGARVFCERGEGNEQHPDGHNAGLREWLVKLNHTLLQVFPLPDNLQPIPEDVFIEPQWKLRTAASYSEDDAVPSNGRLERHTTSIVSSTGNPSTALMPVNGAYTAHIESNDRLTPADHFQDVRLLDLRIEAKFSYPPGAVATVFPKNFPEDVHSFLHLMNWDEVADEPLHLVPNTPLGKKPSNPSPLQNFELSDMAITLRWLLENVLDIMSIPRRSFFARLAHFARTDTDDESYQKERLLELANPELIDELWDYTTRPKRTILEVMMDFTTINIPWQYALSIIPIMRGRQFSIASGGDLQADEAGRARVQLLVAIVDPPSPIIKWRRRYGVCTRYIASLEAGQQISVRVQPGYLDVKSEELQSPVILVGPGTGLAPMRSMIYQRVAWDRDLQVRGCGESLKGDVLFFGCRSGKNDHFFRDEWTRLQSEEGLTAFTAFSRDADQPRQYVQDLIRANGKLVSDALFFQRGKVYVCGSSGNMPKGVRQALFDVITEHSGLASEDVEGYLADMEKTGRYKQETW